MCRQAFFPSFRTLLVSKGPQQAPAGDSAAERSYLKPRPKRRHRRRQRRWTGGLPTTPPVETAHRAPRQGGNKTGVAPCADGTTGHGATLKKVALGA
jgi:hypothetical protein